MRQKAQQRPKEISKGGGEREICRCCPVFWGGERTETVDEISMKKYKKKKTDFLVDGTGRSPDCFVLLRTVAGP